MKRMVPKSGNKGTMFMSKISGDIYLRMKRTNDFVFEMQPVYKLRIENGIIVSRDTIRTPKLTNIQVN